MKAILCTVLMLVVGLGLSQTLSDLDKKELASIAKLQSAQTTAKTTYLKKPAAKKAYIAATLKLADQVLVSPALGPKDKYPRSLRLYREVRAADPKNVKAKEKIALIEGIYKSMGRPIPK